MSARRRLILGQGAVVAILIAVVYLTLLRGDDSDSPSGITADGPPPLEPVTHGREKPGDEADDRRPRPRALVRGTTGAKGAGAATAARQLAEIGSDGEDGRQPDTPAENQYGDTVTQLNRKLAEPAP